MANPTPALQPAASGPTSPHAITTKPVTVHTGWIVQVGALESEDNAQKLIEAARNSAHGLLNRADPFTEPMIAKDGRKLHRVRFAGLKRDEAEAVCRTLRRSDIPCLLVSNQT